MAIKAKHELSVSEDFTATVSLDYDDYTITRSGFNEMITRLMNQSDELVERLFTNCGYKKDEVTHVQCVGGSSLIPYVQERLNKLMGKTPLTSLKPELAVCLGATLCKAVQSAAPNPVNPVDFEKLDIDALQKLALSGNFEAQYELGSRYCAGNGVSANYTEGAKWLELAAEQGYADAQYEVGVMYAHGIGVSENKTEGAKWFRLSAEQGYAKSQFQLGLMYEYGTGVPKNVAEAFKWYRLAADNGHDKAIDRIRR